ncbi:ComF family protein [Roseimaritima ulvae]|nr:phosphoribosyltransferase family protein [Roseimaritima ulvae]
MPLPLEAGNSSAGNSTAGGARCVHCKKLALRFSRTFALGLYQGVLQEAVILAKQATRRVVASTLASLAAETHREALGALNCELVSPIPSHWRRRVVRRGTPAQVLAETFAAELNLPVCKSLRRIRSTRKQGMLSPEERRKNVDGSFAVNTGYVFRSAAFSPRGKHVLLVDDVLTTGATGNAAATALLQAGASEVTMAVIARATG